MDAGGDTIYFTSGTRILAVAAAGGELRTVTIRDAAVTALFVRFGWSPVLHWGQADGAVFRLWIAPTHQTLLAYQNATAGRRVTSVGWDGATDRTLWTDCSTVGSCQVRRRQDGTTTSLSATRAFDVQGDATAMFWAESGRVMRLRH